MRTRSAAVATAVLLIVGTALLILAVATRAPAPLVRPSDSPAPTASPTPTPTATPTVAPTVAPTTPPTAPPPPPPPPITVRPLPTTNAAGLRMLLFYPEVRALFPLLPPTIQIDIDEPAGTEGNAWYRGLNVLGQPIFAVREDFVMDRGTAAHEIGHAYQTVLERSRPVHIDVLTPYWTYRGFPGTWQLAQAQATAQTGYQAFWITSPLESWAEAFRAAVMLEVKERTLDYGKTIDPPGARAFFRSLAP